MLAFWGIDARGHSPRQVDRAVCDEASAIFVMAAPYVRRLLIEYGADLGVKSYLFADPSRGPWFCPPPVRHERSHSDTRPASDLCTEHAWMRERVAEINEALQGRGRPLVPAASYLDILADVDPKDHESASPADRAFIVGWRFMITYALEQKRSPRIPIMGFDIDTSHLLKPVLFQNHL